MTDKIKRRVWYFYGSNIHKDWLLAQPKQHLLYQEHSNKLFGFITYKNQNKGSAIRTRFETCVDPRESLYAHGNEFVAQTIRRLQHSGEWISIGTRIPTPDESIAYARTFIEVRPTEKPKDPTPLIRNVGLNVGSDPMPLKEPGDYHWYNGCQKIVAMNLAGGLDYYDAEMKANGEIERSEIKIERSEITVKK